MTASLRDEAVRLVDAVLASSDAHDVVHLLQLCIQLCPALVELAELTLLVLLRLLRQCLLAGATLFGLSLQMTMLWMSR